jgi:hypothetical protein
VTGCVEDDRVNVDPTTPLSDQFDTDWSPISQDHHRHLLIWRDAVAARHP